MRLHFHSPDEHVEIGFLFLKVSQMENISGDHPTSKTKDIPVQALRLRIVCEIGSVATHLRAPVVAKKVIALSSLLVKGEGASKGVSDGLA